MVFIVSAAISAEDGALNFMEEQPIGLQPLRPGSCLGDDLLWDFGKHLIARVKVR